MRVKVVKEMAKFLGESLPSNIAERIKVRSTSPETKEAILLASVDESGFPNIALLSYSDIVAVSSKIILVAIGQSSSTKKNLIRTRKGTLILWLGVDLGLIYVKCVGGLFREAMESNVEGFTCSAMLFTVERVTQDNSPEAPLLSTLTYDNSVIAAGHTKLYEELEQLSRSVGA